MMSPRAMMVGANCAPVFWSSPGGWAGRAGPRSPPWKHSAPLPRYGRSGPQPWRFTATANLRRTRLFTSVASTRMSDRWRNTPSRSPMTTRDEAIHIKVDDERITGTLVAPDTLIPGVLFVHGWGGSQESYLARAPCRGARLRLPDKI